LAEQIAYTPDNAKELFLRYYRDPASFMQDILRMQLDDWQKDLCSKFHKHDRFAISSGHSSGKSAMTAGIIIFFMAMHPHPQVITTANTEKQLTQKTWRELAKWHNRSLVKEWFTWTATKFCLKENSETWFASAVPQTEHNSEAFAGAHEKFMLQIFDEASAIPSSIYEVSEGATATEGGYRKWFLFGNPTQNAGSFYDACFGRQSHRWHRIVLDTRKCRYADQAQIADWEEDYGVDSDFFRVRVLGLPPQQSITTLIAQADVDRAVIKHCGEEHYRFAPKVLGVDCARFGDDETVICFRQGLKLHWIKSFRDLNEMDIAQKVSNEINNLHPQGVFFDNTGGYGAGAYDRLIQLGYNQVMPVNFSSKADNPQHANKRMEIWDNMREWFTGMVDIPTNSHDLARDLVVPEYFYNISSGKKQLESKKDIKKRLGRSPDHADALALTFAYKIQTDEPERFLTQGEKDWQHIIGAADNSAAVHI